MDNGEEKEATMMVKKEIKSKYISYYEDNDKTVLPLDLEEYNKIQFEFMAIMPNENLSSYVENITKKQINEIDKNLKLSLDEHYGINVLIPKFKFNYNLKLNQDLNKLGIKETFSKDNANFSKMTYEVKDQNLFVYNAFHKTEIKFTEEGLKEGTVTIPVMTTSDIVIATTSISDIEIEKPIDIIINKPFMFIIRDKNTKDVWFTETVYEPNLWEVDKKNY